MSEKQISPNGDATQSLRPAEPLLRVFGVEADPHVLETLQRANNIAAQMEQHRHVTAIEKTMLFGGIPVNNT